MNYTESWDEEEEVVEDKPSFLNTVVIWVLGIATIGAIVAVLSFASYLGSSLAN